MHKKLSKNSIWWILYTWLRQIFQLHKLPCCVDRYWWNMPFKGAQHGDGVAGSAVAMFVIASNVIRHNAGYGFSQWEEALLCNAFSHWPSPYPEWSLAIMPLLGLDMHCDITWCMNTLWIAIRKLGSAPLQNQRIVCVCECVMRIHFV